MVFWYAADKFFFYLLPLFPPLVHITAKNTFLVCGGHTHLSIYKKKTPPFLAGLPRIRESI